jgi:hypothetical protein
MSHIDLAIREALYDRLVAEGFNCKIGSTCKDSSYIDYSNAIEINHQSEPWFTHRLVVVIGERYPGAPPHSILIMWTSGDYGYRNLGAINTDIAEPEFKNTFAKVIKTLEDFLGAHKED